MKKGKRDENYMVGVRMVKIFILEYQIDDMNVMKIGCYMYILSLIFKINNDDIFIHKL